MSTQPPAETEYTPERVRELIAREYSLTDTAVAAIRSAMMGARISDDQGTHLIEVLIAFRDISVRLLRELLGESQ